MKKRYIVLGILAVCLAVEMYIGYYWSTDYLIAHKPKIYGIVQEIAEDYVVIAVNEDDAIYVDYPVVHVSRDVLKKDCDFYGHIGDGYTIVYDGNITDGDPPKAETVYALLLVEPRD